MTELKTHVNNENGTYEVTLITDNKDNYALTQYLIRGFIDNKQCSVTVADKTDSDVVYVNQINQSPGEKVTLFYYDNQMPKDSLQVLSKKLRESFGGEILFLPKGFDVYLNASKEQLLNAKALIDKALRLKETE